jgi:hypothetical protein
MNSTEMTENEIKTSLVSAGLFESEGNGNGANNTWRISPEPYYLTESELAFFQDLGGHLHKFYTVLNKLYLDSHKGKQASWIAEYLDLGKPQELLDYCRMKRFKNLLPGIIRPDVIVTEDGYAVTELDSVPGGFGLTTRLMQIYERDGIEMVGEGIPETFFQMMQSTVGQQDCTICIVVSDEAGDYRQEMDYIATLLRESGKSVYMRHPADIRFTEEGLYIIEAGQEIRLDAVYRFFELFDLKNIPKSELLMYCNKKALVKTTPPYKPWVEEKLSFALFHHPSLKTIWENGLGGETFAALTHLIPKTWVLDNRPLPPYGVIPDLVFGGKNVREWQELLPLTQKERQLVIKPSGFSPDAWGSRGVVIGHDVSSEEWASTLEGSLENFNKTPSILQEFHKGRSVGASYFNSQTNALVEIKCRVRLTPYYFLAQDKPKLGGILATLCPQDKKKIHGMKEAIMVPCAVKKK